MRRGHVIIRRSCLMKQHFHSSEVSQHFSPGNSLSASCRGQCHCTLGMGGETEAQREEYSNNTIERSWAADSPARVPCPDRILRERGRMPSATLPRLLTPSQPQVVLTSSPEMFWLIPELPRWHCWLYLSYLLLSHALGTSLWECGNPVPALHPL